MVTLLAVVNTSAATVCNVDDEISGIGFKIHFTQTEVDEILNT